MYQKLIKKQFALINSFAWQRSTEYITSYSIKISLKISYKKLKYEILIYLSYLPDISPTDYHLFRHLQLFLKNKIFDIRETTIKEFLYTKTIKYKNEICQLKPILIE